MNTVLGLRLNTEPYNPDFISNIWRIFNDLTKGLKLEKHNLGFDKI